MTVDNPADPTYFQCENFATCGNNFVGSDLLCGPCSNESRPPPSTNGSDGWSGLTTNITRQGSYLAHSKRVSKIALKGKKKGQGCVFFECNYCDKGFQGPTTSAILGHLRKVHHAKCSDLLLT